MDNGIYEKYGIDYAKGLARCLNDREVYEQLLKMFIDDSTFLRLVRAYEEKNYSALFTAVHEMKGLSGNIDLSLLYGASCDLVEYLRKGGTDDRTIDCYYEVLKTAYERTIQGINLFFAE